MTAEELARYHKMAEHPENGMFIEKHYEHTSTVRAASGSIYYYVGAKELTEFHVIDCDEYWCYTAGSPLEVWIVEPSDGSAEIKMLGTEKDCEPLIYVPKGKVFASRHPEGVDGGTFLTCITVPRFSPEGFTMLTREEMLARFPGAKDFYR